MKLQELHDELLQRIPAGASHDRDACPYCAAPALETATTAPGGAVGDKTYSEDEVRALIDSAVAERTAELSEKLRAVETHQEAAEIDQKVDAAVAEWRSKVAEIQAQLDTAVLEAEAARSERDDILGWLEAEKQSQEAATIMASRRAERIDKVNEVASFPAEHVEANAERWAAMEEDAFTALLHDYSTVAQAHKTTREAGTSLPRETAMNFERGEQSKPSAIRAVLALRAQGVDTRIV